MCNWLLGGGGGLLNNHQSGPHIPPLSLSFYESLLLPYCFPLLGNQAHTFASSLLLHSFSSSSTLPHFRLRDPAITAAMASTARLSTSCSLATGSITIGSRKATMAAIGCAPGGSRAHRRSAGLSLCCSSTAGAQGGRKMEDYNSAMKRMMRNPYEYHHDLGMGLLSPPLRCPHIAIDARNEIWAADFLSATIWYVLTVWMDSK
jgi:hypothetical protein